MFKVVITDKNKPAVLKAMKTLYGYTKFDLGNHVFAIFTKDCFEPLKAIDFAKFYEADCVLVESPVLIDKAVNEMMEREGKFEPGFYFLEAGALFRLEPNQGKPKAVNPVVTINEAIFAALENENASDGLYEFSQDTFRFIPRALIVSDSYYNYVVIEAEDYFAKVDLFKNS